MRWGRVNGDEMKNSYQKRFPNIANILWTIYAILLTIIVWGVYLIVLIDYQESISFLESLDCSLTMIGILSLYGLGLKKKIINRNFWKVYFIINLLLTVLDIIFHDEFKYNIPPWLSLICWLIPTFYFIGLFVYAYRSPHIWKVKQETDDSSQSHDYYKNKKQHKHTKREVLVLIATCMSVIFLTFLLLIVVNNRVIDLKEKTQYYNIAMLKYRRDKIPQIPQYEILFPKYRHYLIYSNEYSLEYKPEDLSTWEPPFDATWYLEAGIFERYVIEMRMDVKFFKFDDFGDFTQKGSNTEPAFTLWEITSIDCPYRIFGAREVNIAKKEVLKFDKSKFQHLYEANGDWSKLGVQLEKNKPVKNFDLVFYNNIPKNNN